MAYIEAGQTLPSMNEWEVSEATAIKAGIDREGASKNPAGTQVFSSAG